MSLSEGLGMRWEKWIWASRAFIWSQELKNYIFQSVREIFIIMSAKNLVKKSDFRTNFSPLTQTTKWSPIIMTCWRYNIRIPFVECQPRRGTHYHDVVEDSSSNSEYFSYTYRSKLFPSIKDQFHSSQRVLYFHILASYQLHKKHDQPCNFYTRGVCSFFSLFTFMFCIACNRDIA